LWRRDLSDVEVPQLQALPDGSQYSGKIEPNREIRDKRLNLRERIFGGLANARWGRRNEVAMNVTLPRAFDVKRSRAGVLAASVAAAILANSATAALAEQAGPVAQQRDEAVNGYQQPRLQDLPPDVAKDEERTETDLDAIAKELEKLESRICPGC
jgi:hypothetical protein